MIRATGITKSYGTLKVLKGVNLEVSDREIVAIAGASGAGKTTLLQILGTLDRPDSGSVFYNETETGKLRGKQLAGFRNRNIGFVFQFHQLLPEFTALENICIPAYIAGKGKYEAEKRARELLEFLKMTDRANHKPSELSGGEQQRVAVARALVNNPSVILADEPSGNLDTENKTGLHRLFFSLRDTFGHTFIIVTHDRQLASLSDRIIQLKDGLIVDGSQEKV
ncbi:MAG TPA: ABC transporter ATP-binding protein [Bacteroidales bacterium]|nr:ABC transporter ATP-binding protein [Bacteroidales bacterium]HRR92440.1 ABC transporter ATP-binding protein [Bacteroidales bacterium]HRT90167.1 ABC transporter ATP-binding protein [Bacteroidales bacterium]